MTKKEGLTAIYPGSFDPITNGHLDIIDRGIRIFDKVIIAVAENIEKTTMFTVDERIDLINKVLGKREKVSIVHLKGLLVESAQKMGAHVILKGLRAVSDFEYEFEMAMMNRRLNPEIETFFMMTAESNFYISSRRVKEVMGLGGSVKGLVPDIIMKALEKRMAEITHQ